MSSDPPTELPLFPLGTVLFPAAPLPLHIFEERYRRMMADRQGHDPIFGVVLTRQGAEVGDQAETYDVGTSASLLARQSYPDGRLDIAVVGTRRFRILGGDWSRSYLVGSVEWLDDTRGDASRDQLHDLRRASIAAFSAFVDAIATRIGAEVPEELFPDDPAETSYAIAARLPIDTRQRQAILEVAGTAERLRMLTRILVRERALLTATGAAGAILEHPARGFSPN